MKCEKDFYDCSKIADQLCFESKVSLQKNIECTIRSRRRPMKSSFRLRRFDVLLYIRKAGGLIFSFAQYISHKWLSLLHRDTHGIQTSDVWCYTISERGWGAIFSFAHKSREIQYLSQAQRCLAPDGMVRMPLAADIWSIAPGRPNIQPYVGM